MLYNKFSHKIFLTEKSLLFKLAHILDKFCFQKEPDNSFPTYSRSRDHNLINVHLIPKMKPHNTYNS